MNNNLDIIYNMEYLVVVSASANEFYEDIKFTFKNVVLMNNSLDDMNKIIDCVNKNNFKQVIFVNYIQEYEDIINKLNGKCIFKFICTFSLAALSDPYNLYSFETIYGLYKNKKVDSIGFLDAAFYDTLSEKNDVFKIDFDSDVILTPNCHDKQIGLLNNFWNANHSFYNELSAVGLSDEYIVNLYRPHKITKKFLKLFGLKHVVSKSFDELICSNDVNLYINFTSNNVGVFLRSMDCGVPCIVGNNSFLRDYKVLQEFLMVKSDDNIDEINHKIDSVLKNKEKIFREYKKFRADYRKNTLNNLNSFIGKQYFIPNNEESYEKLLTIVVPVYNVEKYIKNTLDSIISSLVDNCEILIINDGSNDGSEKIIKEYMHLYPDIIRYIYQENRGLGNVRNVALREAKGKYIASIDSDDTINSNFFTEALPYLKSNIDMVIYDFLSITDNGNFVTPALDCVFDNESVFNGLLYTTIMPSTCNKIIKKSLFNELNIKYIEDKYEDLSTNPFVMLHAKTIKYIDKPYYEYYIRGNSIMRSSAGYSMIKILKEFDLRLKKYNKNIFVDEETFKFYTYSWRIEEFIFNQLYDLNDDDLNDYINYIYDNLFNLVKEVFSMKKYFDVLTCLDSSEREYIEKRNIAFGEHKLYEYIIKSRKTKKIFKLTPAIIYYGK